MSAAGAFGLDTVFANSGATGILLQSDLKWLESDMKAHLADLL